MTSVGKHFFMAQYGKPEDRAAHIDSAFSKMPAEDPDAILDNSLKKSPHYAAYTGAFMGIKSADPDILQKASHHSNHVIRSMVIRTVKSSPKVKAEQVRGYVGHLTNDPHPYVISQLVKHTPGMFTNKQIHHISEHHPDQVTRETATRNYTDRMIFNLADHEFE